MDGAYVKAKLKDGSEQQGIVWRYAAEPLSIKVGDEVWGVTLNRRSFKLPFTVKLDKFVRELHPGTDRARKFTAMVTVTDNGLEHKRPITMNEPLRSGGYALFQQSFDLGAAKRGGPQTSTIQVVRNPSDHWPLISCIAAACGLMIHMGRMLIRYLHKASEARQHA